MSKHQRPAPATPKRNGAPPETMVALRAMMDQLPRERDTFRHELRLPSTPFGSKRSTQVMAQDGSVKTMAMDDAGPYPYGGYLNTQTVAGQLQFGLYFPGYPYLAELAQRTEYRQPVETLAKEMTRRWIKFKSKGKDDLKDKISQLEEEFERFNIQLLFRKVTEHDGYYGLGMIYIKVKGDSTHRNEPLVVDERSIQKGDLIGFNTVEPMWITPLVWNSIDPTEPTFYNPEKWVVLGMEVHHTRLLKFLSREVPDIIKPAYNFGGISLTQLIDPYVQRWLKTVGSVNTLINNFSIITLATDMATVLSGGDAAAAQSFLDRMKLFLQHRDNQGLFLLDKNSEELSNIQVAISGLAELQQQALEHMAYPTHEPLVILTGTEPSGLNTSSEGQIQIWHNWVHSLQEQIYRPNLERVLKLIELNLWGKVEPDITFDFEPLAEVTGKGIWDVQNGKVQNLVALHAEGVVDEQECRQFLASDKDSGWDNLDVNKQIEAPDLLSQGNMRGEMMIRG